MTATSISICISKEVGQNKCTSIVGIDRNLRNVTVGNDKSVTFYKTNKLLSIKQNTIYARAGFHRNDHRKKKQLYKNLKNRLQNRTKQFIHKISKDIVNNAVKTKSAIAFEDLKGIRKLYRKGNGQGNKYRRKLNGWPFYELQRQVQYKAKWEEFLLSLWIQNAQASSVRYAETESKRTGKILESYCALIVAESWIVM